VDIETDILDAIHRVFLSSGLVYCSSQQPQPTSKRGPFYNGFSPLTLFARNLHEGAPSHLLLAGWVF
jgi:hypothetical protein